MKAYFRCLCGANRQKAKLLSEQGYEVRVINQNPEWRKEALEYKTKLPFKVTNGKVEEL